MRNIRITSIFLLMIFVSGAVAQELKKEALETIVARAEQTNSDALIILKGGKTVYKNYFGKQAQPIEAMSATKSIVSLAIGLLIDQGHIKSLDMPVSDLFPEWKQGRKRNITIRHLLEHTSGIQNVANAGLEVEVAPDAVKLALAAELESDPGSAFSYNNKATNLLPAIVEKASGMKMDAFLERHLFGKLGITEFSWRTDKAGTPLGMAGLMIFPEDLAKIGQLILNKGKWNGDQVISDKWLNLSFAPSGLKQDAGLLWWLMYEKQWMVIDDAYLSKLRPKVDDATFALLERLKGKYEGFDKIQERGPTLYSKDELSVVGRAMSGLAPGEMRIENEGPIVGYAAVGYLGQHLIVLPGRDLVIVRMIAADSHKAVPNNSDFPTLRRLAKQL